MKIPAAGVYAFFKGCDTPGKEAAREMPLTRGRVSDMYVCYKPFTGTAKTLERLAWRIEYLHGGHHASAEYLSDVVNYLIGRGSVSP